MVGIILFINYIKALTVRVFLPAHVKPLKQIEIDFTTFICKINDIKQGKIKRWITNTQDNEYSKIK